MKQILSLALALLPCLAWAQYPSNGNQKITLGEQTTADGLVYRGLAADTTRKPSVDTMAYIILDTTTNLLWHYKKGTSNAWLQAGGGVSVSSFSAGTTGLTPSTATTGAVTLGGTLAVANGGTNASTFTQGSVVFAGASGTYTQDNGNLFWDNTSKELGIGTNNPISKLDISLSSTRKFLVNFDDAIITMKGAAANGNPESIKFVGDGIRFHSGSSGSGTEIMRINSSNRVGIMTNDPTEVLHVVGNGRFTAVGAGTFSNNLNITSDGTLTTATSDEKFKYNIRPLNYGLSTLLQLKPVNFQWIEGEEEDLGFIAQDVAEIIPEAVNTNWNSDLLFRYESLIPILTKAIQEQQSQIDALKQRLLILENK